MAWIYFICLCLPSFIQINCENTYKTVETENGTVRGILSETLYHQKQYYSFKGIPFAKPPVGELRFKVFFDFNK